MSRGFGVAAGLDPEVATSLAQRCEQLGYSSIWSNDHPAALGLETLAAFAEGSPNLELGVAVMALDRHQPAEINDHIERLGLDRGRLWLGVGAGFSKKPLSVMRDAVGELREAIPGVRLALACMGPKMCALAGTDYDAAFLNWCPADVAAEKRAIVHEGASEVGRIPPPVFGYVRVACGEDAQDRMTKEESFYRDLHDGYRRHFESLDAPLGSVGIAAGQPTEARRELEAYDSLDMVVVRGLASANLESMAAVAEAAIDPA